MFVPRDWVQASHPSCQGCSAHLQALDGITGCGGNTSGKMIVTVDAVFLPLQCGALKCTLHVNPVSRCEMPKTWHLIGPRDTALFLSGFNPHRKNKAKPRIQYLGIFLHDGLDLGSTESCGGFSQWAIRAGGGKERNKNLAAALLLRHVVGTWKLSKKQRSKGT
ncbi:hypothetical protein LSM04_004627 [Trypanosoma melophagium]|uniref:uncharacterized protein n=1 Tax=Trypanosoma melophagium TaxID=715481 RepID=UPI00351A8FCC|nr:hypothetical protein LSM04_004627 [Trypanosoma melophagium]